jgi:hypothetical protein
MKKTHNGEKGRKTEHISVNNGQPGIILKILYFCTRWVGLSQKTISHCCSFDKAAFQYDDGKCLNWWRAKK